LDDLRSRGLNNCDKIYTHIYEYYYAILSSWKTSPVKLQIRANNAQKDNPYMIVLPTDNDFPNFRNYSGENETNNIKIVWSFFNDPTKQKIKTIKNAEITFEPLSGDKNIYCLLYGCVIGKYEVNVLPKHFVGINGYFEDDANYSTKTGTRFYWRWCQRNAGEFLRVVTLENDPQLPEFTDTYHKFNSIHPSDLVMTDCDLKLENYSFCWRKFNCRSGEYYCVTLEDNGGKTDYVKRDPFIYPNHLVPFSSDFLSGTQCVFSYRKYYRWRDATIYYVLSIENAPVTSKTYLQTFNRVPLAACKVQNGIHSASLIKEYFTNKENGSLLGDLSLYDSVGIGISVPSNNKGINVYGYKVEYLLEEDN